MTAIRFGPIAIVAIGVLLRFVNLGQAQLFRDEAASWVLSSYPIGSLLQHNVDKTYPPLYALLLRGWMLIFGTGEAALRSPSAIPGAVTVIVAWLWTRQAVGRGAGLMAAAVVAVSALLIANSREARMYSLETAFATVAWWLSWRLAADTSRPDGARPWRTWATAAALAVAVAGEVWTMAFGLPVAALQLLFAIACYAVRRRQVGRGASKSRSSGPRLAILAIVIGTASLSTWLPSLLAVPLSNQGFWTPKPDLTSLHDTFYAFLGVTGTGLSSAAPGIAAILAVAGIAGLSMPHRLGLIERGAHGEDAEVGRTAGSGAVMAPVEGDEVMRLRMFGLAAVLGIGLVFVVWIYSQRESVYDPRYLGAAAAPVAALIAAGLTTTARMLRSHVVGVILAVAILGPMTAGALLAVDRLNADVGSDPGRQTAQLLVSMVQPGDVVLTLDARTYFPLGYYLDQTAAGTVADDQLFDWDPPGEPFYLGTSLISADRLIDPGRVAAVGWQAVLPGLGPRGTIWLVSIANGNATDLGFSPLTSGPLLRQSGATIFITPVDGNVGQIRPLVIASTGATGA